LLKKGYGLELMLVKMVISLHVFHKDQLLLFSSSKFILLRMV